MTAYKSDKISGLMTYATDGSLIRFIDGRFTATRKAQRDVLDKMPGVRKDVSKGGEKAETKPKKATKKKTDK